MQIDYVGRNVDITDEFRNFAEKKIHGVTRFLENPIEIRIVLSENGHRRIADLHVHHKFGVLQAEEEGADFKDAILEAIQKTEKQARRSRKKFQDKRRRSDREVAQVWPVDVVARASVGADATPRVVKTSSLSIKPMSLDEAALKLENAKNDFIVFRDSDHGRINVLYKRRDGDYGLVTPGA